MPTKHLTDRAIKALKTGKRQEDYWDSSFKVRGVSFGIRVYESGAKEYICRYRNRAKQRPQITIGDAAVMSLADGRSAAAAIKTKLDNGLDPAKQRDDYKKAETFTELCDLYLRHHAERHKKDGGKADKRVIEKDLKPAWGKHEGL